MTRLSTSLLSLSLLSAAAAAQTDLPVLGCMLEPSEKVEVSSPVSGVLQAIPVERGQQVRRGKVLFSLHSGVEQAAVELAKEKAGFAGRNLSRNEELYADDLLSPHERDEIETEKLLAELELRVAREELALRSVKSPISGVVVERNNSPGEYVSVDPILTVASLDPLYVDVLLPYENFGQLNKGDSLLVRPAPPVGGEYRASISIVDPIIDAASSTFRIRLELDNSDNAIPAGIKCSLARPADS